MTMTITPTKTMVALTIDGIPVHAPAGTSVMHAARDAGIAVAKLCGLSPDKVRCVLVHVRLGAIVEA